MNLDGLSGLLRPGFGDVLADLASKVPADQAIVEIGSFRGKSTAYLATGAKSGHGAQVHAVDPWDLDGNPYGKHGFCAPEIRETFEAQLRAARVWSRVTPHRAFSVDAAAAWDGPEVGLLFVDGDHTETGVRTDVDAWTPHLAASHVLVFDDYRTKPNPGVAVVVDSLTGYAVEIIGEHLAVLSC